MGIDYRHDHSFKLPRIAESRARERPGLCVNCHGDQSADWITETAKRWYGQKIVEIPLYAQAFAAVRARSNDAESLLLGVLADKQLPPIVRATAAQEIGSVMTQNSLAALQAALSDPSELVRLGALSAIETLPVQHRWALTRGLLADPSKAIRVRVAGMSGDVPGEQMTPQEAAAFGMAYEEFMAAATLNADTPESNINQGNFYLSAGNTALAESFYRKALALDPLWVPSYLALADVLQLGERDAEIEGLIRQGMEKVGETADLYFTLGMARVRQSDKAGALEFLRKATALAPENGYFAYVYAVALDEQGKREEAIRVIDTALAASPNEQNLMEMREGLQRK
jgi:tetratricopeptide (TPR) repeat protein